MPHPNNIRKLREQRGLTQQQLSDMIGKTRGYLFKLETGERGLRPHEARDLADALGVAPADLLSFEDGALAPVEREFLEDFRRLPEPMKAAVRETARAFHSAPRDHPESADQDG